LCLFVFVCVCLCLFVFVCVCLLVNVHRLKGSSRSILSMISTV